MGALGQPADPPYLRIAAEIRARISSGELRAGDKVPSTRQITQEWGVAMATATKVLVVLRQEGLVRAVPGVGTVVEAPDPRSGAAGRSVRRARSRAAGGGVLTRERIVRTAVSIADADGSAAVSMRTIAAELGVSTMALYRHVPGKDELVELMADAVFGDVRLPACAATDWRGRLEASARTQWALYRRHPWLAKAMSFTRPLMSPHAMAQMDWAMRPLHELGLRPGALLHITVAVAGYVRGVAVNLEDEADAEQDTGMTQDEWIETRAADMERILAAGHFPVYERMFREADEEFSLDSMFEFGLARLLDGLEPFIAASQRRPGPGGRGPLRGGAVRRV
ncbi:TetR/AcrR family transcriptional regulator C-terminal domain-containing protein [Streptomyces sp. NPDC001262]|uniref:TetR/AcrR family transcriptional regulator C-terminal domain-containing protein n=1 Tax=unclassified Streptomyces TaxID=2593676 RepID=UPI0036D1EBE8